MKILTKINKVINTSSTPLIFILLGTILFIYSLLQIYELNRDKMGVDYPLLYCLQTNITANPYDKEMVLYVSESTVIANTAYYKYSYHRRWAPTENGTFNLKYYSPITCEQADILANKD